MEIPYHDLVLEFGTPTYVYDGSRMTGALAHVRNVLHSRLEVFYSLKANPNISVFALLNANGARAEVSSLAELRTVLAAGAAPEDVIFLGPGKSDDELDACISANIYAIVCEAFDELDRIERLAGERGVRQRVLLRINPASSAPGARLAMGGKPRQFGIDEKALLAERRLANRFRHADLAGVQVYCGSRILDWQAIAANTGYALDLAEEVAAATGIRLDAVDIGGGFGVPYFEGEHPLDLNALAEVMNPAIERFAHNHPDTRMILEMGRFLVAAAGVYLVRVRSVKESHGQSFVITDGGTHHHLSAVGIGSIMRRNFPIRLLEDAAGPEEVCQIAGLLCTPNDLLGRNVMLPKPRVGDVLGIFQSGAYGLSASPGLFISHGFPAEVLVHEGKSYLIRERDEPDDLLRKQRHHNFR
ncbi:type III PLP-dependent enzyme [Nonomuraea sp. NPDC050451]|uniref:type III PLP-dependent enzyme n=1 Tax=Nonomuraea sp. NPDC050451 TaxID=3364364 RepID=UPI0037A93EC2